MPQCLSWYKIESKMLKKQNDDRYIIFNQLQQLLTIVELRKSHLLEIRTN